MANTQITTLRLNLNIDWVISACHQLKSIYQILAANLPFAFEILVHPSCAHYLAVVPAGILYFGMGVVEQIPHRSFQHNHHVQQAPCHLNIGKNAQNV